MTQDTKNSDAGYLPLELNSNPLGQYIKPLATGSTLFVAFSEGCLAGIGIALLLVPHVILPVAIAVGIVFGVAGYIANYYLFHRDTEDMLRWLLENSKAVDWPTNVMQKIGFIFALGSGISCGALSLVALHGSIFVPLFLKMGVSVLCAAGLGWGFAILPALFTAVAITAIFSQMISKFVKEKSWMLIGEYFKNTYYPHSYNTFTSEEKIAHWLLHVPIHFLKLVIGLAIAAIVTFVSFGMFRSSGVQLLRMMTCSAGLAYTLFSVPAVLFSMQNFIFGVEKMFTMSKLLTVRGIVGGFAKFPVFLVDFLARLIINAIRIPILLIPYWVQVVKPDCFKSNENPEGLKLLQWNLGWFTKQRDAYYKEVDEMLATYIHEDSTDNSNPASEMKEASNMPTIESPAWWKWVFLCTAVLLNSIGYGALAVPFSDSLHMGAASPPMTEGANIIFSAPQSLDGVSKQMQEERMGAAPV